MSETHERRGILGGFNALLRHFSPSERLALYALTVTLALSTFILLVGVNDAVSTQVPTEGGSIVEGAVGTPRFINPVLATTDADQDLAMLTYSGLLRVGENGLIPDLAGRYEISDDGKTYTFHLREGLAFHDGTPLTSADILFTIALVQNPDIKSPRRADWDGVAVTAPDDRTVVIELPHAYAPFLENATLGILPKSHWENVPAEEFPFHSLNTHPIGSGPYMIGAVLLDTTGAPTEYTLEAFPTFALGKPHVSMTYRLYSNDDALLAAADAGDIESFVASSPKRIPREVQDNGNFLRIPLTRIFGVFLNQNHAPVLADASVREALDVAIDKETIIAQVLGGYGSALTGPVPESILAGDVAGVATSSESAEEVAENVNRADAARGILADGGWEFVAPSSTPESGVPAPAGVWTKDTSTLSLKLATADAEELVATAQSVADAWTAAGIPTEVEIYPLPEFNQDILRPRTYDAILFGEAVGRSLDLYPFWHSSQRNDPGLNLSLYTNAEADRALASARTSTNVEEREKFIREFLEAIGRDNPAVFLYSPEIAYLVPSYVKGITVPALTAPSERFASVHEWYRDTERIWDIFSEK
ncbi:MAG: ABC transporter substrate-binding protein [Minisyncoccia bacterium]